MGSEDFSFMLQRCPGAYARLGQGGAEGGCFLHNSRYDFNDDVIPLGAGYLAALAEHALPLEPLGTATMNAAPHFAQTYGEARDKFLAAARSCGARIFRDVHPSEHGAEGEELSIDWAAAR